MATMLNFDVVGVPSIAEALRCGVTGYATNESVIGPPATLWLRLGNGQLLRVGVEMHDLLGWEEIGTLTFEIVGSQGVPEMVDVPVAWLDVQAVQKLVYVSEECEAESGLTLRTTNGETLTILPGAEVYTLAIEAPFYPKPFNPENDLSVYVRKDL
jgi:hypothetical protein